MMVVAFFILLILFALASLVFAWKKWSEALSRIEPPRWRRIVIIVGLCAVSLQGLLFLVLDVYGRSIGGWSHNYRLFNIWGRVDFYLFVVVVLAVLFGKGRSRPWMFLSSLVISGVWFLIALSR
jgi:hypothetical protein